MLTAVESPNEIDEKELRFIEILRKALSNSSTRDIGYHGGGVPAADVHWSERLGIWTHSRKLSNRYWNAFGTMPPSENQRLEITCEANIPLRGTNRRIAGVFLVDQDTEDICIGHSGRIGGGRKNIGRTLFLNRYPGLIREIKDKEGMRKVAIIGSLGSDLPIQMAYFVREVARIKRRKTTVPTLMSREPTGGFPTRRRYTISSTIQADLNHNPLVVELSHLIKELGFTVGWDINRDLYIKGAENQLLALFEVKPEYSLTNIYSAIGQLKYNSLGSPDAQLIAVLPVTTPKRVISRLGGIGIQTITFRKRKDRIEFRDVNENVGSLRNSPESLDSLGEIERRH